MQCLRQILDISRLDRLRNETVHQQRGNQPTIEEAIQKRRLQWFGHVCRMDISRLPYNIVKPNFSLINQVNQLQLPLCQICQVTLSVMLKKVFLSVGGVSYVHHQFNAAVLEVGRYYTVRKKTPSSALMSPPMSKATYAIVSNTSLCSLIRVH